MEKSLVVAVVVVKLIIMRLLSVKALSAEVIQTVQKPQFPEAGLILQHLLTQLVQHRLVLGRQAKIQ